MTQSDAGDAADRVPAALALSDRLAAGDATAFDDVFRTYFSPLRRYAYSFVHSWEVAEDLAQGVFVQLWVRIQRSELQPIRHVQAYLYNATRGDALDYLKHEKVKDRHHRVHSNAMATSGHIELADWEAELASRERVAALQQAVDTLPPRQREILLLRLEQTSYAEIAARLHLSVNTVEVHVHRALTQLRRVLRQFLA